jgi:DamX protein
MENDFPAITPSPYLAYYGMTREPFAGGQDDDIFYAEPGRKQRLDLLLHLTQYGNELLFVTAPEGYGKTTLLNQFQAHALETWNTVRLDAANIPDERKLVQQLCREFGVEYQNTAHAEILHALSHFLDGLLHNAHQGVVLLDNAHLLSPTALKRLTDLSTSTGKDNKPLLRVILFGEDSLSINLKDPALGQLADAPKRHLDLPPFSEEESIHYILHRLSWARFADTEPFTDAALQKICKEAGGNPASLNQLAHQLLLDSLPLKKETASPILEGMGLHRPVQLAAGLAALAIIVLLLISQWDSLFEPEEVATAPTVKKPLALPAMEPDTGSQMPTMEDHPLSSEDDGSSPEEPSHMAEIAPPPTTDDLTLPQEVLTEGAGSEAPLQGSESKAATETAQPMLPPLGITEDNSTTAQTTPETTRPEPPQAQAITPASPQTTTPPVDKSKPVSEEAQLPARGEDWIRHQSPGAYTLQLVAGRQPATLTRFIAEHHLGNSQELAYYQGTRDGAPWHGLIYGSYPNKQAAIDARSRLPEDLRRGTPWVRDFAGLQNSLP